MAITIDFNIFWPGQEDLHDSNLDTENLSFRSFEILKADIRMSGYYVRCIKK